MKRIGSSWRSHVERSATSSRSFEALVADAIDALPDEIRARMDNVSIVVDERASPPDLLGLYHGIPLTDREGYAGALPDVITIYRRALEARARSQAELEREVRVTVWHEIAHHFGISDARLGELDLE